jgi:hypothetical protein
LGQMKNIVEADHRLPWHDMMTFGWMIRLLTSVVR